MIYETGLLSPELRHREFGRPIGLADPEKYRRTDKGFGDITAPIGLARQDVTMRKASFPLLAVGIVIAVILIVFGRK